MRIRLEQVFYGCGPSGYAVLGGSPGAKPFTARVEALCGAVGTPAADYGGEPFLMSVSEENHVLMICGRRGTPDSIGRGTLIFHALVGLRKDLDAANANAFKLFDQGAFADRMPDGEIDALQIEAKSVGADRRAARNGRDGSTNRPPDEFAVDAPLPCFIRTSRPAPDVVRSLIDNRANDLAWATYAFRSMPGFDIQVLPPRIPAPNGTNECDAEGNLLHGATPTSPSPRGAALCNNRGETIGMGKPSGGRPLPEKPRSTMLNYSFAANVVLALLCVVLLATRSHTPQMPKPSDSSELLVVTNEIEKIVEKRVEVSKTVEILREPSPAETNAIGQVAVDAFRKQLVAELATAIPEDKRIRNFDEEKKSIPYQNEWGAGSGFGSEALVFLGKLAAYVTFVNTNTNLQEKTQP